MPLSLTDSTFYGINVLEFDRTKKEVTVMTIVSRGPSAKLLADLLEYEILARQYTPERIDRIKKGIEDIKGFNLPTPPISLINDLKAIRRKKLLTGKIESGLDFLGEIDLKLDQNKLESLCEKVIVYGITRHNIFSRAASEFLGHQLMWLDTAPFTPEDGKNWIQKKLDEFGKNEGYTIEITNCPICVLNDEQLVIITNAEFREEMLKVEVEVIDHLQQLFAELDPGNSGYRPEDLPHWGGNND